MIETERLVLRRWIREDIDAVAALNADPDVMRWIGDGTPYDRATSEQHFGIWRDYWDEHDHGLFALQEKATGQMIGFTGLMAPAYLPALMPSIEIGWRLRRDRWGKGFATEAARAALAHGFDELGLNEIIAVIRPENEASKRVAEKIGLRVRETIDHPLHGWPLAIYAIRA